MNNAVGLRLICVDDEKGALVNCKAALDSIADVSHAKFFQSPLEAITHVKGNSIDVALLDIDMPEMSGFDLAKKLKEVNEAIKIVFITGNISYMRTSNRPVNSPFIFKPYTDYEVADVLEQIQ